MTDITTPHPIYKEMLEAWKLPDALNGGTTAMREAGIVFLPQEPREGATAYAVRKSRSFLFSGYSTTVKMLSSKPFQKSITITGDITDDLKTIVDDVDMSGSNLTKFTKEVFKDAINHGLSHILIDMPSRDTTKNIDKASQKTNSIRPYFVHIKSEQLISWTSEMRNGKNVLTSATIKSKNWKNKGTTQVLEYRYTVYTEQDIKVYSADTNQGKPSLISEAVNTLGIVPLVTYYADRLGFMHGKPALTDLAWTNLAHWQSSSDQRNILKITRCAILFAKSFGTDLATDGVGNDIADSSELDSVMTVSANSLTYSSSDKADLRFVEHGGAGIEAGERDGANLKIEMSIQGASFITPKDGDMTATEYEGNEGAIQSDLQAMITNLEDSINQAFNIVGLWLGQDIGFSVSIFKDFNISFKDAASAETLLKACIAGKITTQTYLTEIKRRGLVSDQFDIDTELEELEAQDDFTAKTFGAIDG